LRRFLLLAAIFAFLLSSALVAGVGSAHGQARASTTGSSCPAGGVTPTSTFGPPNPDLIPYLSGDPRLGPKYLPGNGTIARMLTGYVRFSYSGSQGFLLCYWRAGQTFANWRYPADHGFVIVQGQPAEHMVVLHPGQEIDLFGNPGNPANPSANKGGQFVSPAGTLYRNRALPPTNLDTYSASAPFNYYLYQVRKAFSVMAGRIAPWFGQPGGGIQDYLAGTTGPGLPANPGIANLVQQGYVREMPVTAG
jgi:Tuberculosis necrotizing toxin